MDEIRWLALAVRLAGAAAAAITAVRAAGFVVERKRDRSPVTAADTIAEALIVEGLRESGLPVVAEEAHDASAVAVPEGPFWLVDPLDGTRDFAEGQDSFAVNIGLVRDGRPVLGAVALPAHGQVFSGIVGRGAWRLDAGGSRPIRVRPVPEVGAVAVVSRRHGRDPRIAAFARDHNATLWPLGSAEKLCRVAEGTADLYPRRGPTMEWDTAAPEAVLLAAGGRMADWDGVPLRYGKPGWRNTGFLAMGGA
jgi:3'(2'), 5'-bisphosphate nucleotidase